MIVEHEITVTFVKRTYGEGSGFNEEALKDRIVQSLEWLYGEVTNVEVKHLAST